MPRFIGITLQENLHIAFRVFQSPGKEENLKSLPEVTIVGSWSLPLLLSYFLVYSHLLIIILIIIIINALYFTRALDSTLVSCSLIPFVFLPS